MTNEENFLNNFQKQIDYEFRIKATPLKDIVEGVDWKNKMVKGRAYGDFAVSLCELTGTQKT